MVEHHYVRAVSFTGGTATGAAISALAAPKFKKLSLELGGKNATVVFDDCDFDEAVSTAVRAAFSNQGQICLCGSRILIQEALYDRFRDAMVAKVSKMRIGDPMDPSTRMGGLAHNNALNGALFRAMRYKRTLYHGSTYCSRRGMFLFPQKHHHLIWMAAIKTGQRRKISRHECFLEA